MVRHPFDKRKSYPSGLCVFGSFHISAYTQPMHLILGTVIDIVSIFYYTKNPVGGLWVGGVSNGSLTMHSSYLKITFSNLPWQWNKRGTSWEWYLRRIPHTKKSHTPPSTSATLCHRLCHLTREPTKSWKIFRKKNEILENFRKSKEIIGPKIRKES